jgi:hypothetical protein
VGRTDWQHRGAYIHTRSQRRPGDTDIDPLWADEAVNDTDAAWLDPDPKSKSGRSTRVIGHSPTAGMVITVILVPKDGQEWWGANAWKANDTDIRIYREGQP